MPFQVRDQDTRHAGSACPALGPMVFIKASFACLAVGRRRRPSAKAITRAYPDKRDIL